MGMVAAFLLACCGYQIQHQWIAKDLYANKSFVVLNKNIVGDQYGNNVFNMRLKDMKGVITDEHVTSQVYYDSELNTTVVLYGVSDDVNYTLVKLAYFTYVIVAFGLVLLACVVFL